jgi:formylglycine-generating enzyme required for sulfatase activity
MVFVPAGNFTYGSGETRTTEAFFIDIHEVTAGQYKACVEADECDYNGSTSSYYRTYNNNRDNHPINYVSWHEAVEYCTWKGKRLPTEVEWEKAARGTDGRTYPWGDETATCDYAVMYEGGRGCGTDSTWPVGQKLNGASPYGVHDMAGNVWEWTDSWSSSSQSSRVLRGGSFNVSEDYLRSSDRGFHPPAYRNGLVGFRCSSLE